MRWEYCWANAFAWDIKPEWFEAGGRTEEAPKGLEGLQHLTGTRCWCLWTGEGYGWVQLADALNLYGGQGWELTSMGPGQSYFYRDEVVHTLMFVFKRPAP